MEGNDADLMSVLKEIREARHFDFRQYKRASLQRRIERRIAEKGCASYADYLKLIAQHPPEIDALISTILINVTSFFRDKPIWRLLERTLIPLLLASKNPGDEIRVWSAGCATGEEAYSFAILLAQALGSSLRDYRVKVFATDPDQSAISFARQATYSAEQVADVPPSLLERWFDKTPHGHVVRKELRHLIIFGINNLASDAPISRIDFLLCRNVFIYLGSELQKRVLNRFEYSLRHDGVLVLGKSELIPFAARVFQPFDLGHRIYRKNHRLEPLPVSGRAASATEAQSDEALNSCAEDPMDQSYRDSFNSLPLPIIATNLDGAVTLFNSAASAAWGRSAAEVLGKKLATLNLAGLTGEILIDKSTAVRNGRSQRETRETTLDVPGRPVTTYKIDISPIRDSKNEPRGLHYILHDITPTRAAETELARLQDELTSSNERMQTSTEELRSSNEELETTNEELQSANEELQTTNEELQSTNEELETTNEELQSTNAELDATNRELEHRTEEMHLLGFYYRSITRSLSSGVIVLDPAGRITIWNLAAERLLGLPEGEAINQTFWTLRVASLSKQVVARIRRSLANHQALRLDKVTYELPSGGRGHASVAAIPVVDQKTYHGALIIFEDSTRTSRLDSENVELRTSARRQKARNAADREKKKRMGGSRNLAKVGRAPRNEKGQSVVNQSRLQRRAALPSPADAGRLKNGKAAVRIRSRD